MIDLSNSETTPRHIYEMRRKWNLDQTSFAALQFKPLDMEDPAKRHYAEVTNIAQNLWENFSTAALKQPGGRSLDGLGEATIMPGMPTDELHPVLGKLYEKAEVLTGVAVEILTDGFGEHSVSSRWIANQVGRVIRPYDLRVIQNDGKLTPTHIDETGVTVGNDKTFSSPSQMFEAVASRLNIEPEKRQDPKNYQLIALLVGVDKLIGEARNAQYEPPTLLSSSGPEIVDRYNSVIYLMDTINGIAEEEVRGGQVSQDMLMENLGKGLAPYNLRITSGTFG